MLTHDDPTAAQFQQTSTTYKRKNSVFASIWIKLEHSYQKFRLKIQ